MSEISFQAVQFFPRFIAFIALLAGTWLTAKFAKYLFLRATCGLRSRQGRGAKATKILAAVTFWSVFVVMMPFLMNIAGFSTQGIYKVQNLLAQIFANWPLMMVLSLVAAGVGYLVRGIPRFYVQVKSSIGPSQRGA